MKREYKIWEANKSDNCENMIEPDEEHQMEKIIRAKSMERQKVICSKRYKKILNSSQCRPSIYIYMRLLKFKQNNMS